MTATSLDFTSLATQAARLAAGELTSAALTAAALGRAHASQPTLNAFRHLRDDAALAEAADADRRLRAGDRAPLLGVPVAVKDDVDLAGLPLFGDPELDGVTLRRLGVREVGPVTELRFELLNPL